MRTFLKLTFIFLLPVAALIVLQYLVDPFNIYPPQLLPPIELPSREEKVRGYLATDRGFDAFIMGSSRVMRLDAEYVGSHGYRCYNFGVANCRAEDLYALVAMILDKSPRPPRLIILGLDAELFHPYLETRSELLNLPELARYLQPWMVIPPSGDEPILRKMSNSLQMSFVSIWRWITGQGPDRRNRVLPENGNFASTPLPPCNAAGVNMGVNLSYEDTFNTYDRLSETRRATFEAFLALAVGHGVEVRAFITCLHPQMTEYLSLNTPYEARMKDLRSYLDGLNYPGFTWRDFSRPENFGGLESDFLDPAHVGSANAAEIVDRLLGEP
ncbi:MAG: hypothetical protein NTW26_03100 [bacterium]|nr:hypothetical protein [bacterium]